MRDFVLRCWGIEPETFGLCPLCHIYVSNVKLASTRPPRRTHSSLSSRREDLSEKQTSLHRPHFVDSNARNKRIGFGKFLRSIKILRLDDVVTSNRFHIPW